MTLYLVTAPPVEPVTLAEAKLHARIDHNDEDVYIQSLIKVAREKIDGRDGVLGRAIVLQTWDWKIDRFDRWCPHGEFRHSPDPRNCSRDRLEVPLPSLQLIETIKYLDSDNVEQTWPAENYIVTGINGWGPASVAPAIGSSWPQVNNISEAIRIRIKCGYVPDDLLDPKDYVINVPEVIKLAIKIMVAAWFEDRSTLGQMPDSVGNLLASQRMISLA